MEMEERLFPHLLANEPQAIELTKKEYEDYRSFEQFRAGGQDSEDVPADMGAVSEEKAGAPFQGTKAEAEKILKERGFTPSQLRGKRRQELIDMLESLDDRETKPLGFRTSPYS